MSKRVLAPRASCPWLVTLGCMVPIAATASPTVPLDTVLRAIEKVESGGNPLAIRDNSGDRALYPASRAEAVQAATALLADRHNIDVGAMQVNRAHFSTTVPRLGFRWEDLFDEAVSLQVGRVIFTEMFGRIASRLGSEDDRALWRTVGSYNGGERAYTFIDNVPYQARVAAAMGGKVWPAGPAMGREAYLPPARAAGPDSWRPRDLEPQGDPPAVDALIELVCLAMGLVIAASALFAWFTKRLAWRATCALVQRMRTVLATPRVRVLLE